MDMMQRVLNLIEVYEKIGHVWYIEQAQKLLAKEIENKKKATKAALPAD